MNRLIYILGILIISACTSSKGLISMPLQESKFDNYGTSKDQPILIGYYNDWQKNTSLALYYLTKLSYNDKPLKCILHQTIQKPANQPRKEKPLIQSRNSIPKNMGGEFLDLYVMITIDSSDTLSLYFDMEIEGQLELPKGFKFDSNQINNIFQ